MLVNVINIRDDQQQLTRMQMTTTALLEPMVAFFTATGYNVSHTVEEVAADIDDTELERSMNLMADFGEYMNAPRH